MEITYKNVEIEDAKKLWDMMNKLDTQTEFMLFENGERKEKSSLENLKNKIETSINQNDFLLIAKYKDEIVGFINAEKGRFNRISHTAYIVVGILQEFRAKKIGTRFFDYLDEWSLKNNITRLELTVMCHNEIAIKLYQKNGFVIEGTKKKSIKLNNEYIDEYYMAKILI